MRFKTITPLLWGIFSAGGTVAAIFLPVHLFLTGVVFPLNLASPPSHEYLATLMRHPLAKLYFLMIIATPLFHWAHRFRYTLYDGLQIKHLTLLIVAVCYGGALVGSCVAAYTIWTMP